MRLTITLFTVLVFSSFTVISQETNAPKFGKGLFNLVGKDSSWTMKVGTRMQFLTTVDAADGESPSSNMLIRRARLKFDGYALSPKLKYKIELGLSNRDISGGSEFTRNTPRYILDAVVMWNFTGNFVLWAGQTKLPGNIERVISSGNLQQVDRSLVNSRFNIDRDVGFQLRHHFNLTDKFLIREKLAFSQGEGRNVTQGNEGGHQYTGRIEFLPFGKFISKGDYSGSDLKREEKPKLMFAINYDINKDAVKTRSNLGSYMTNDDGLGLYETTINTFFFDGMFKYNGLSIMWEYAERDADDPIAKNSDGTLATDSNGDLTGDIVQVGKGLNVQSGYLFKNNWEISGRFTNIKLDESITGKAPQDQYTLGISKYIVGHKLKVQSDFSLLKEENENDSYLFRLQVDMHF